MTKAMRAKLRKKQAELGAHHTALTMIISRMYETDRKILETRQELELLLPVADTLKTKMRKLHAPTVEMMCLRKHTILTITALNNLRDALREAEMRLKEVRMVVANELANVERRLTEDS